MVPHPPKVIISRSSQDNDRFVLSFAQKLRSMRGYACLDIWEMLFSDSLVDKIWNEGLKGCVAMILVLSEHSVKSKWVKEELDAGLVKKIERRTKLIALRLGECDVPKSLRAHNREDINDPANYDAQFGRILNSIHGHYERLPIGQQPPYAQADLLQIVDLDPIDSIIFEAACRTSIEIGHPFIVEIDAFVSDLNGISEDQVMETQSVLDHHGYIDLLRGSVGRASAFKITPLGFDQFAKIGIPGYSDLVAEVSRQLVECEQRVNFDLVQALQKPKRIIDHILTILETMGLIETTKTLGGRIVVTSICSTECGQLVRLPS